MEKLPRLHHRSSHATAIAIAAGELHLEPVRVLDGRWCIRRNGRLVPMKPGDADAFIMPSGEVDNGTDPKWPRLSEYLADRGVFVPGGGNALAAAEKAGHWSAIAVRIESWRGRGSDGGVSATLARGLPA